MSSGHRNNKAVRHGTALLVAALVLASASLGCSSLSEHMAIRDAARAYKAGKYEDAAKNFETALRIDPKKADNWKYLGYSYWSLVGSNKAKDKEYADKSLEAFQKYLKLHGPDDELQDYIISIFVNQDRIPDGIKYYEASLKENPRDARVIQVIATLYTRMGDFKNSLKYSEMKAALTPNDPGGYLFIGALCWDQSYRHNKEMSLEDRAAVVNTGTKNLDTALKIDVKNMNAYVFYGLLLREKSDVAKLQADGEKDRRKKKELMDQSEDYLKQAVTMREKALEIRKASQATPAPGAGTTAAPQK